MFRTNRSATRHQELARLLATLGKSRIANNINQLAKAANSGSLPGNMDVLKALNEAVSSIQWIRQPLIKAPGIKAANQDDYDDPESQ